MRITHLTDAYRPRLGGIEAQVSRLAERQAASGHRVEVITTTPARPGDHGVSTRWEGDVAVRRLASRSLGRIAVHPRAARYVAAHLANARPDMVHLHMGVLTPSTQSSLPAVVEARVPAVATVHSMWGPAEYGFRLMDRVVGWSMWPVAWSAVSEKAAAPLRRVVGEDTEVAVIPNGIDLDQWAVARLDRRSRPGGPALHIVAATRFASRKRVMPLLRAVGAAHRELTPTSLRVTLAGDGPDWDKARRFVTMHGLGDVVSLPGPLDGAGLRELYARADVFAAPAIEESFGIAALEAQTAGLAIVSRSQSGIAERITDGVEGLLADDDEAMARAFVRLARDDGLLDAITRHNGAVPPDAGWDTVMSRVDASYARAATLLD